MKIQLAESLDNYFNISNGIETARVNDCFTQSATVHDEGGTYQGLAAIESWLQETRKKYQFNSKPISIAKNGHQEIVVAEVSGNFTGSPIQLKYVFVLNDGKIQSLEIS
ncbi:nuclear transport factor 2 family protein [Shewanella septentrionalis]|uniref:Nuclear transport factor 2 family protein n=1 Tax=Shewanella septentrionalis TaxID=2952223 RepID=A0A9X2WVY0_9GAMM|nr:nuclear transport factor 2 family protein [Shewanella septentrionalis]MCT7946537.1 nuclear transport factor 2 family protein [Shewanella septentrionalis]